MQVISLSPCCDVCTFLAFLNKSKESAHNILHDQDSCREVRMFLKRTSCIPLRTTEKEMCSSWDLNSVFRYRTAILSFLIALSKAQHTYTEEHQRSEQELSGMGRKSLLFVGSLCVPLWGSAQLPLIKKGIFIKK